MLRKLVASVAFAALASHAVAGAVTDAQIHALARSFDHAQFEITDRTARIAELSRLEKKAADLAALDKTDADPIVWEAIILSSRAGAEGGISALGEVTRARDLLLQAEKMNPSALGDASIYTSLGSIYAQVPGFPIGFGDKTRARTYLKRALAMNPAGIDANYFMADFLLRNHESAAAIPYLKRALAAPARPGREVADAGRRRDAQALLEKAQAG